MNENRMSQESQFPGMDAVEQWKRAGKWEEIAALAAQLERPLRGEQAKLAEEVAFALSQLARYAEARELYGELYALDPTRRLASALAYVHYAALLAHKIRKPRLENPEEWRKGFEHWVGEALKLDPKSLKDRYRLAMYYATVQSAKDHKALRLFAEVARDFEALPDAERTEQNRFFKTYVRSLYGAARSAYRLGRFEDARRFIFRCIRLDRARNHQKPVFKYFLAAKVLVALQQYEDAERGLRLAVESAGNQEHDFVYALLAQIALATGRAADGVKWIEQHIRPHHRKPYIWRLLADCEAARGDRKRALKLYKNALLKDHAGRHLTLYRMGQLYEAINEFGPARRAYEEASDFRRKRYLSEFPEALEALAKLCERQGDVEGARKAYTRMSTLPAYAERAQAELQRLAG